MSIFPQMIQDNLGLCNYMNQFWAIIKDFLRRLGKMLNTPNTALPWYDVCLELLLLDFNIFYIKCELYTTTRALEYTTCSVSLLT